ncbi:MAG: hypothetical protein ACR2ML_01385 [Solirubrobacteraceae bacterium]
MALWWIWNIVLLAVVVPVVLLLLTRVVISAVRVRKKLDDIAVVGAAMVVDLGAINELPTTDYLVGQTMAGLAQYGAALDEIL